MGQKMIDAGDLPDKTPELIDWLAQYIDGIASEVFATTDEGPIDFAIEDACNIVADLGQGPGNWEALDRLRLYLDMFQSEVFAGKVKGALNDSFRAAYCIIEELKRRADALSMLH